MTALRVVSLPSLILSPTHRVVVGLTLLLASACAGPSGPLDGEWKLASTPSSPLDPRTLVLHQRDTTITGSGTAMGVDVPVELAVMGSVQGDAIEIRFRDPYNGSDLGRFTATLAKPNQLVGRFTASVVYGGLSDSLMYARQ